MMVLNYQNEFLSPVFYYKWLGFFLFCHLHDIIISLRNVLWMMWVIFAIGRSIYNFLLGGFTQNLMSTVKITKWSKQSSIMSTKVLCLLHQTTNQVTFFHWQFSQHTQLSHESTNLIILLFFISAHSSKRKVYF